VAQRGWRVWRPPSAFLCWGIPLLVLLLLCQGFGLRELPPWLDESTFLDVARTFRETGHLGSRVDDVVVPGAGERLHIYPPLYLCVLAAVGYPFGISLVGGRLLSCLMICVALGLTAWLLACRGIPRWVRLLLLGWAVTHMRLVTAANIVRPDALLCLLAMAAHAANVRGRPLLAGLAGGGAVLTHPVGLFVPLGLGIDIFLSPARLARGRRLGGLALGLGLAAALWVAYIAPNPAIFWPQFGMQLDFKLAHPSDPLKVMETFLSIVFGSFSVGDQALFKHLGVCLLLVGATLAVWRTRQGADGARSDFVMTVSAVLAFAGGQEGWYGLFVIPFIVLCLSWAFTNPRTGVARTRLPLVAVSAAALIVIVLAAQAAHALNRLYDLRVLRAKESDVGALAREVERVIPERRSVLVAGSPNLYAYLRSFDTLSLHIVGLTGGLRHLLHRPDFLVVAGDDWYHLPVLPPELKAFIDAVGIAPLNVSAAGRPGYNADVYDLRPLKAMVNHKDALTINCCKAATASGLYGMEGFATLAEGSCPRWSRGPVSRVYLLSSPAWNEIQIDASAATDFAEAPPVSVRLNGHELGRLPLAHTNGDPVRIPIPRAVMGGGIVILELQYTDDSSAVAHWLPSVLTRTHYGFKTIEFRTRTE
jgi:hypothetical protein